ncbi:hypothetical protein POM88_001473 [Heracleum sosnowskyi]|uniref:Myb/SANT-like domain-containing protein n=1 Tax=Heracleum sosnowskyi TaxID=360622 RepID=A0AAD8NBQ3_9APIA|nr:hypothetical protein POM88_001473 [Heracleum sosnowskyi]
MDPSNTTQNQSNETQKKGKVYWRGELITKTFLETCIEEVTANGRLGSSLKPHSWVKVGDILKKTHGFEVDARQMRNRYDYLRNRYVAWCQLKSKTGNHYNPVTNSFNFTEEEWDQLCKRNKYVETLKSTPLCYPELCTHLYDGIAATGVSGWGPSSKRRRIVDANDEKEIPDIEEIQSNAPNAQSAFNIDTEETPKKRNKASPKLAKITEFENEMTSALKLMVQANSGPSLKECKEKLNNLGWGATNPLHKMALGIFCESAKYREQWILLEENENADWVKMVSTKLGLNA